MVIKGVLGGEGGILRSLRSSGFENILVLDDEAPSHRAAVAKAARAEMGIETLDRPPSSPDLNPIENVWYPLKTKIAAFPRVATSLDEFWEQMQKAWDEIDLEQIRDLIDEMEQRRVAVWKAKGKSTQVLDYCKLYIESAYVLGSPENMHCRMIHAIDVIISIGRRTGSKWRRVHSFL